MIRTLFQHTNRFGIRTIPVWIVFIQGCGIISFNLDPAGESGIRKTTVVSSPAANADSVTVVAGDEYSAGGFHRWLWGDHYRSEWTTPFPVPVLDLGTFADGLTPVKRGGGYQTKSLRFKGNNGKLYAFRSINKDPTKALPPELRETFAGGVIQDQISSSHPAAPLVVDVLADALGVLHPKPVICILPDDERLKEFRPDFAGILGILEDYPADGPDGTAGFAGSKKILSTLDLFDELEKNSEDHVNASAYLTARLLDILVGDWDRHIDQWRWAKFEENGNDVWYPIPRDRDQAFAKLDGIFPSLGRKAITQVEGFDDDFPKIADLTYSGRNTDRMFLSDLDRREWDSITTLVMNTLSDSIIDVAISRIPEPLNADNAWLSASLKSRRNNLPSAAREYYTVLAEYVDIHLSDKDEMVVVDRVDETSTRVNAYRIEKESRKAKGVPVFSRTVFADETTEIRIYMHGGDDKAIVTGKVDDGIAVRIIGGGGDDTMEDSSEVKGWLWGFLPFSVTRTATYFYDDKGNNTFTAGAGTRIDKDNYNTTLRASQQY